MRRLITLLFLFAAAVSGAAAWWLHAPLTLGADPVDLSIEPGTSPRAIASQAVAAGIRTDARLLFALFRLSGQSRAIKAGSYEVSAGTTPLQLLNKLARGEEALRAVTLVEGWNFQQVLAALRKAESLAPDAGRLEIGAIMERLGRPGVHPEGRFFPDTYTYSKGSSDLAVLRRAMHAMDRHLAAAWEQRDTTIPLTAPEQLLTIASIVEKETGSAGDRDRVAAVFMNRLRIGMPLQTDPTVIYGLGDAFDGNLRRRDLITDTPYNTYTRGGLPPTPIAMPGKAALLAAAHPARTQDLYFVARGDGSSQFSRTLEEHNRAVNRYIRGQRNEAAR